jgi:hypothetical protein
MPLRDHFRPPLDHKHSWNELHGGWPAMIVAQLSDVLPHEYAAGPRVHLGGSVEIDVSKDQRDQSWAPPAPTFTLETDLPEQDEYEVRVYDARRGRKLVAAILIVSPSNKDRPESRRAFVAKTAALLQQDVCVSIVDVVTIRQFNLYVDLLALIGREDPALGQDPPHLYAVTLRGRKRLRGRPLLDTWFYPMTLGRPLPQLPIWLDVDLGVTLDLEASYEDACRVLRMA